LVFSLSSRLNDTSDCSEMSTAFPPHRSEYVVWIVEWVMYAFELLLTFNPLPYALDRVELFKLMLEFSLMSAALLHTPEEPLFSMITELM